MVKKSGAKGVHWKTILFVALIVAIGIGVALYATDDVRYSPDEVPEGEVVTLDESEFMSITGEDYDDALTAAFDDEYTSNESEDDSEAWADYYASCGDDGSATNSGSDANSGSDSGSSCDAIPQCAPSPELPVVKSYSVTKIISSAADAQSAIASVFSQAVAGRATTVSEFKCLEEDKCKKKGTSVSYSLSIEPLPSDDLCTSTWTNTYSRSFSANGPATTCHPSLNAQVTPWTAQVLKGLEGPNDPCPKCSFYTVTSQTLVSNEEDTSCSTDAQFKVSCGPKRQGFFKSPYKFKLDVTYSYSCYPIPPAA